MKTPAIISSSYVRRRVDEARRELEELAAMNCELRWACPICFGPFVTQQDANGCCSSERVNVLGQWIPSDRRWYCKTCRSSFPHSDRDDAALCCVADATHPRASPRRWRK